jgi:hypothetical protein
MGMTATPLPLAGSLGNGAVGQPLESGSSWPDTKQPATVPAATCFEEQRGGRVGYTHGVLSLPA